MRQAKIKFCYKTILYWALPRHTNEQPAQQIKKVQNSATYMNKPLCNKKQKIQKDTINKQVATATINIP